ncbi:MAG: ferritin-like domain-containing protein, partial [Acidimicrobiales bacterium]|nr:ferritin-like domain-containing protein [Acidimicrobiales bacterium]
MSTNEEIIGRTDINDLEAILAVSNTDVDAAIRTVKDNADAIFTWDYEKGRRPALNKLYEKAKVSMWNGETDLDWSIEVDQEQVARDNQALNAGFGDVDLSHTPFASWSEDQWVRLGMEFQNWSL